VLATVAVELLGWLVWALCHHASGKDRAGGIQSTLRLAAGPAHSPPALPPDE